MTSNPYSSDYAALYDMFYSDKPYDGEVSFLAHQLERFGIKPGARLLELACGTGEHAIRFAKRGYQVVATDYSAAMVELARRKAEAAGVPVTFMQCDMRELPVPGELFDAAFCLFDSIGYVRTDDGVAATFAGVRQSLKHTGVFAVEYWHAPAMIRGFDRLRVRRLAGDHGMILRLSETELDERRCLAHVTYNVYDLRSDSTYRHIQERHTGRYFTVPEMDALARRNGLERAAVSDGFTERAVSDDTWHVLTILRSLGADGH